ncbi:MAG: hypothetical protein MUO64_08135 [Anaerolineales bacterium]|nr:hypothetical protein [Anaerolineales bacterium]
MQAACAGTTQVIVVTATPVNSPVVQVVTVIITPTPVVVSGDTPQPPLVTTEPPGGVNVEQTLTVQAAQFMLTSQAGQAQSALTVQAAQAMLTAQAAQAAQAMLTVQAAAVLTAQAQAQQQAVQQQDGVWSEVPGGGTTNVALAATNFNHKLYVFAKRIQDTRIYFNTTASGY